MGQTPEGTVRSISGRLFVENKFEEGNCFAVRDSFCPDTTS